MHKLAQLENNQSGDEPLIKQTLIVTTFLFRTMATLGFSSVTLKSSVILLIVSVGRQLIS